MGAHIYNVCKVTAVNAEKSAANHVPTWEKKEFELFVSNLRGFGLILFLICSGEVDLNSIYFSENPNLT